MEIEKYIINHSLHGYNAIDVTDENSYINIDSSIIVVVVDSSCDEQLHLYYKAVDTLLRNYNRIILLGLNDGNKVFKVLASLLVTYKDYDIYDEYDKDSKDLITGQYLLDLEDREPDIIEVQNYIGGDVTAYNDLSAILFGIESLVKEGNIDALKEFIDEHILSIENFVSTLNSMRKKCEAFDSHELFDKVGELQSEADELSKKVSEQASELESVKYDRDSYKVQVSDLTKDNSKLKAELQALKDQGGYGPSVISAYKELNISLINCKTKMILYFKEISYVPYCNTLISKLQEFFEKKQLKTKLLVYDSQTNLYKTYKPLTIVTGKDYVANKDTIINKNKQVVIAEPVQAVIQDILQSEQCFDVVIIYDRIKEATDIVSGNNVAKFYILNSSKDYAELKKDINITDTSFIITHANSSITNEKGVKDFLDIPFIPGFSGMSNSAASQKYFKLVTAVTGQRLIETIAVKSRINTLYN